MQGSIQEFSTSKASVILINVANFPLKYNNMNRILLLALLIIMSCAKPKSSEFTEAIEETEKDTLVVLAVSKDARTIGPEKSSEQWQIEEAIQKMTANKNDSTVGYWVGMFGKNKINIAIAEVKDGKAIGYTVCAGNYRPITGTVEVKDNAYSFVMNEPGTDKYDGNFKFTIDTNEMVLKGEWSPFKKAATSAKEYELSKMAYFYQPGLGEYPEASSRLLTETDVENLLPEELEFMRNEIYARHGYSFEDIEDRRQFDVVDWYIPMGIDIREKLTDIEVQNIDLIYRYEEYYNESYDDYGR